MLLQDYLSYYMRFSNIHEGEEIRYKIPIKNEGNLTATLRGSQIYDALPRTAKAFAWILQQE